MGDEFPVSEVGSEEVYMGTNPPQRDKSKTLERIDEHLSHAKVYSNSGEEPRIIDARPDGRVEAGGGVVSEDPEIQVKGPEPEAKPQVAQEDIPEAGVKQYETRIEELQGDLHRKSKALEEAQEILTDLSESFGSVEVLRDFIDSPDVKVTWRIKGFGSQTSYYASLDVIPTDQFKLVILRYRDEETFLPVTGKSLQAKIQYGDHLVELSGIMRLDTESIRDGLGYYILIFMTAIEDNEEEVESPSLDRNEVMGGGGFSF